MVVFFNTFISYLIIVLVTFALIVCAVILGKKLRDNKDKKDALKAEAEGSASEESKTE